MPLPTLPRTLGRLVDSRPIQRIARLSPASGRPMALLVLGLLLMARLEDARPLQALRLDCFDFFQVHHPQRLLGSTSPVAIIAIDEDSVEQKGPWPWPRDRIAQLLNKVGPYARVVGFDLVFPERDEHSPEAFARRYPDLPPETRAALARLPSTDSALAHTLATVPTVLGLAGQALEDREDVPAFIHPALVEPRGSVDAFVPAFDESLHSTAEVARAAAGHGALNRSTDTDGVVRRLPSVVRIGSVKVPGLTVEMLRLALHAPAIGLERDGHGMRAVTVGNLRIPTDPDGSIWIPFTRPDPDLYFSAAAVLDAPDDLVRSAVKDRLVLIGTTNLDLSERVTTPVGTGMWAVELHAQLLQAILTHAQLVRPPWATPVELLVAALIGLAFVWLIPRLSFRWTVLLFGLVLPLSGGASALAFTQSYLLDPSFPILTTLLLFPLMLGLKLASVGAQLRVERTRMARVEGELEAARKIQRGMLPPPPRLPPGTAFDIAGDMHAAKQVGGDLYEIDRIDDRRLFFLIGDVSGKGVPASLFMAIAITHYRSSIRQRHLGLTDIMSQVQREIATNNPEMLFITVFAGILDLETGDIEYCNAGHELPVLLRPGEPPTQLREVAGPPLCTVDDYRYPSSRLRLDPGAALVLFTDGVTEAVDATPSAQLYGPHRALAALAALAEDASAQALIQALLDDVKRFTGGAQQSDDITLLALRHTRRPAA